jgi:soluble lytic murein transglycosylase-like protein
MKAVRTFALAAMAALAAGEAAEAHPRIVALTPEDEARYQSAFEAIEARDWQGVRRALDEVSDPVLEGVVRGRMLASAGYRATMSEYNNWLRHYGDLGVAGAVYQKAQASRPHRGRGRRRRATGPAPIAPTPAPTRRLADAASQPPGDSRDARARIESIAARMGEGDLAGAEMLGAAAVESARAGDGHWWMGLAAFRRGDFADAAMHFENASAWPYFGAWNRSSAHFWAARAELALGQPEHVARHLQAAAAYPYTFYGQLAEAQLGRESGLSFELPALDEDNLRVFFGQRPGARRAAALAQLGRLSDVEAELRRLHGELLPQEDRVFLALAGALEAPSAQLRAAEYGGLELSAGFCPANSFAPDDGFALDRALVYGIVRQESHFNPVAVSVSNARGLMQLLPSTARDMDPSVNYRRAPANLFEPGLNMRLGQKYVLWLMDMFHQDKDLARVFAAYNGGPGWLSRWIATQDDASDPLYLLETLPRAESRDYAERVLAHMGVCRARFGQERVELARLAAGQPARYEPQDERERFRLAGAAGLAR